MIGICSIGWCSMSGYHGGLVQFWFGFDFSLVEVLVGIWFS